MKNTKGFTLIELLIVVAIIAILAAIAVPNFLEAQVRSKATRTQADLRSLATAIEVYRVDNNRYPLAQLFDNLQQRLKVITTPISYITDVPGDPFFRQRPTGFAGTQDWYCYASGNIYQAGGPAVTDYATSIYTIAGRGPDSNLDFGGICTMHPVALKSKAYERGSYDPTNGTVSEGDIIRKSAGTLGVAP